MLKQSAEFPHPGSTAYVAPHGEEVTIIQRVTARGAPDAYVVRRDLPGASGTYRAEADMVHATQEAAIGLRPARGRGRRRRAA